MTRALLVVGCLVLVLVLLVGMWWGWHNRLKRQAFLPQLPEVPADPGPALLAPLAGVYVGSAFASSWQDRVAAQGLGMRAPASVTLHEAGVLFDRAGAGPLFIPAQDVLDARLAPGLAGKVVGAGGLLVIRWSLGGQQIDSGLRADDKTAYPAWVRTINEKAVA